MSDIDRSLKVAWVNALGRKHQKRVARQLVISLLSSRSVASHQLRPWYCDVMVSSTRARVESAVAMVVVMWANVEVMRARAEAKL